MPVYLISACLVGLSTRYDGGHNSVDNLTILQKHCILIPICPEQLGGLPTPRPPAEICGGDGMSVLDGKAKVLTVGKDDVTSPFIKGARECLLLARLFKAEGAVLKARSPSCGSGTIYDGSFSKQIMQGDGVTAALLKKSGIPVLTEDEIPSLLKEND